MEIYVTIDKVINLNREGIALTEAGKYDEAIKNFEAAVDIARQSEGKINPDYCAVSKANIASAMRQRNDDGKSQEYKKKYRKNISSLLIEAMGEKARVFLTYNLKRTYFGGARLLEGAGSIVYFKPLKKDTVIDLEAGLSTLKESIKLYERALENVENETVDESEINDSLSRTRGIASKLANKVKNKSQ